MTVVTVWRAILRWFGLHREARVQISAPGIEVTLAGEPTQVRALMGVIRAELERKARRDRRNKIDEREVVRPTELDEKDSPYALPEAVVVPVPDDERPYDRGARLVAMSAREPPTLPPAMSSADIHQATFPSAPMPQASFSAEDVESMRTAVTPPPDDDRETPRAARAVPAADVDTLQLDRRLRRVTRPLHPALDASSPGSSKPA